MVNRMRHVHQLGFPPLCALKCLRWAGRGSKLFWEQVSCLRVWRGQTISFFLAFLGSGEHIAASGQLAEKRFRSWVQRLADAGTWQCRLKARSWMRRLQSCRRRQYQSSNQERPTSPSVIIGHVASRAPSMAGSSACAAV